MEQFELVSVKAYLKDGSVIYLSGGLDGYRFNAASIHDAFQFDNIHMANQIALVNKRNEAKKENSIYETFKVFETTTDIHTLSAMGRLDLSASEVTLEERNKSKQHNFLALYSTPDQPLSRQDALCEGLRQAYGSPKA